MPNASLLEYKKAQVYNLKLEEEERAYERRKKLVEDQLKRTRESESKNKGTTDAGGDSVRNEVNEDRDVMDRLLEIQRQRRCEAEHSVS